MTQEQLAMLLGVSRQSVTKWEAEKNYPEMDKLIRLCELFDCTIDDLVMGDLAAREAPEKSADPTLRTDACGYDEHMRGFARRIAWGAALCVFSVVPTVLAGLFFSADTPAGAAGMFTLLAAGCAFIVPAGLGHAAFTREHPIVQDFYTADNHREAQALLSKCITGGVSLVLVGLTVMLLVLTRTEDDIAVAAFLTFVAVATWFFAWGGVMYGRLDVERYNRETGEEISDGEDAR